MGVILAYIAIGLIAWFIAFYFDYKVAARESWCDDPTAFANQFMVFHALAGVFWPIALLAIVMVYTAMGVAWVFQKTIGQGFSKLAALLEKRGL